MLINHKILSVLLLCVLVSCSQQPSATQLYVVKIADGDTFTGLTADKRKVRVRISGIDAPEKGQPYGNKAKEALAEMIFNRTISIDSLSTDRYGRTLAKVYTPDGKDVGAELIRQGLAWHYVKYSDSKLYTQIENEARKKQVGLWQYHEIVPPWEWRKMTKEERERHR